MTPLFPATAGIPAGPFSDWLAKFRASLHGTGGMDVPCGSCTGCCISGYPVPLRPQDARAIAKIPAEFVVAVPGMAPGHAMMRALPDGLCPMLRAGKCTIYAERPQTCVDYDCRIFAAAGIEAGGGDRSVINERVREWRFTYPTQTDRQEHDAVRCAAAFIRERSSSFIGRAPTAPTGIAVLAIKAYAVFLDSQTTRSDIETAAAIVDASRAFDAGAAI